MKRVVRWIIPILCILGCYAAYVAFSWLYITYELSQARTEGAYANPEEGLLAIMDKYYPPDHAVKIYSAGPNAHDGSIPYVWYVIAEVHASARADGSEMGRNGCDAPGMFFIQLKDGKWVNVSEGILTLFMLEWLERFNLAGEGEVTPSTDLVHGPMQFCR